MAAQVVTNRLGVTEVARLANLKQEVEGSAPTDIKTHATVTLTIVYTSATGAITLDRAVT